MIQLALALLGSYLIGSIPTAYLVVKRLKRVDVRTVGSGNVGATNVTRVAGWRAGLVVFLIDLSKGLAAVMLVARLLQPATPATRLACGVAAALGHSFPIFLGFRGGKGVATTIGVLMGAAPSAGLVCMAVWVILFAIWRYVSVASIAAAVTLPITQLATHRPTPEMFLGLSLALLIIARHHTNLARLRQGTEHRFTPSHGRPRV